MTACFRKKELELYAYKNPKAINSIMDGAEEDGKSAIINRGGAVKKFMPQDKASDRGQEKTSFRRVMGLKSILTSFH